MNEIITNIEEFYDKYDKGNGEGYKITTNKQEIIVSISNVQYCCECSGYLSSLDSPDEFINSELQNITITDDKLNTYNLPEDIHEHHCIFVTFHTNKGNFQITVYNKHNGYYSHYITIKSTQITENFSL